MICTRKNRKIIIICVVLLAVSIFALKFYLTNRIDRAKSFAIVKHLDSENVSIPDIANIKENSKNGTNSIDSEAIPFYVHTYIHSREQVRKIDSENIRSWVTVNKGNVEYKRIFWDNEDVRNLIKCHFPEYVSMAHSLSNLCMSDLARYAILYLYGGIYVDTDVKILKPLSELYNFVYNNTKTDTVIIGSEPVPHIQHIYWTIGDSSTYRGMPASTVVIAKSKNPFFLYAMNKVWEKFESYERNKQKHPPAWLFTGPLLLREIIMELSEREKFVFTNDLKTTGYSTDEKINCKLISSEVFYPELSNQMAESAKAMSKEGIPTNIAEYVNQWFEKYSSTGQYTNNTYLVHHWWEQHEKTNSNYVSLNTIISSSDHYALKSECE